MPKNKAISVTVPVAVQAAEVGKARRFSMVAYTGEPMLLGGYDVPVIVDLASIDITAQRVPVLYDHMPAANCVVGQTESIRVDSGLLIASGVFTPTDHADDAARDVLAKADAGFVWQASVGGQPTTTEAVKAGQSVVVNDREYHGPALVARGLVLREISFVVLGGDRMTSAVLAKRHAKIKGTNMSFDAWLLSLGFDDPAKISDVQKANLERLYKEAYPDGEAPPDGEPVTATEDEEEEMPSATSARAKPQAVRARTSANARTPRAVQAHRSAIAAEESRIAGIRELCASAGNPTMAERAGADWQRVPVSVRAIEQGWTREKTELEIMRAARLDGPSNTVRAAAPVSEHTLAVSLAMTSGLPIKAAMVGVPQELQERVGNEAASRSYRQMGLHQLFDLVIRAAGRSYTGSRKTLEYLQEVAAADMALRASAASTVSLSGITGAVANKSLLSGYQSVDPTWPKFCAVQSLGNFQVHTQYRMDSTGQMRKVGPDGELKHAGFSESSYTNQLSTYGAMFSLTRQMMINDELGAFAEIPRQFGRTAAQRIEEAVYVLLLSNPGSFFSAGNNNYMSGGSSALSITSLTTAEQKFSDFVGADNKPIGSTPAVLVVPTSLYVTARDIFLWTNTNETTTANAKSPNGNPHASKYDPVKSTWINNTAVKDQDGAAITGQSSTQWYLFGNPNDVAAINVGFLNGQQNPTIETSDAAFNTLGFQYRVYHDFGVGMGNPKGAVKSAGA